MRALDSLIGASGRSGVCRHAARRAVLLALTCAVCITGMIGTPIAHAAPPPRAGRVVRGAASAPASSTASPLGDGVGVFRPSSATFYLRNSLTTGLADEAVTFGASSDVPLVGDWNGDGVKTVGVFRPSTATFLLTDANVGGAPVTYAFSFGNSGDIPLVGDWNGSGHDGVGVFRPTSGQIFLRNSLSTGYADYTMVYGVPGDVPLAGDWSGQGHDSIGVYRPSSNTFYLTNTNCSCVPVVNYVVTFGASGDMPFTGDWTGGRRTGLGMFRASAGSMFLRDDATTSGPADHTVNMGASGDQPIAGNWVARTLFVGSEDSNLYAVRPSDGTILWHHYMSNEPSAIAVANGLVYAGEQAFNADYLDALKVSDGSLVHQYNLCTLGQCGTPSAILIWNGTLYVGSANGYLYVYDIASGNLLWAQYVSGGPITLATDGNRLYVGASGTWAMNPIDGTPYWMVPSGPIAFTLQSGTIYGADDGFNLLAVRASDGTRLWKVSYVSFTLPGTVAVPAYHEGAVYEAEYGYLSAYNASTGATLWNAAVGANNVYAPTLGTGIVYAGSYSDHSLHALNNANGNQLWTYATGSGVYIVLLANGRVYAGSGDNYLYALNPVTGALLWKTQFGGAVIGGIIG